jgi:hypothetical protein
MSIAQRFPRQVIAAIRSDKILGIRAGTEPHRCIGIGPSVEGRVFVRSWGIAQGWYRTFLVEPRALTGWASARSGAGGARGRASQDGSGSSVPGEVQHAECSSARPRR